MNEKRASQDVNAKHGAMYVEGQGTAADEPLQVKIVHGSEALAEAMLKEPPKPRSKRLLQLYGIVLLAFLCSSLNGYDGSLMGTILVMKPYQEEFGTSIVGIKAGYISALYQIGGVVALPFIGPATDTWGRRPGMFIGCFMVIIGTVIEGTSNIRHSLPQFLAGRFFLGFGVSIAASAAPTYVVEMSHPAYRGVMTGMYNCFYYVGSIAAAGCTRGSVVYNSNAAWLIPTWIQMVCSCGVCAFIFLVPESPRWLFTHGKREAAVAVLTKYHGQDDPDSIWVHLQVEEFSQQLEMNGADKRWWDYRALFRNKSSVYRLCSNLMVAIAGQWSNGGIGYFVGGFYATAGITNPITVLNFNLGGSFISAAFAVTGASFADRWGRRPILLTTVALCCLVWVATTIGTAIFNETGSTSAAKAGIAFSIIFGAVYSFGFTPLQALYPVEVLSYEMRAKGMAFSSLAVSVSSLVNQFGTPVALKNIGWKVYIVYSGWCAIEFVIFWFFLVETKGRTLEELDAIFNSRNPRKASLHKLKLVVDSHANVVEAKEL